jgi:putative flippase GtrA
MNRSFRRYVFVGIMGTLAHVSTLSVLVEWFKFEPIVGSVTGFLVALILSYLLNAKWSFDQVSKDHRQTLVRYTAVSGIGLCLNTSIMFFLVNQMGMGYLQSQVAAAIVVPLHNFILNFYWTFKEKPR